MGNSNRSHLRIFSDLGDQAQSPAAEIPRTVAGLTRSFSQATGWPLEYVSIERAESLPEPLWSAVVEPAVGAARGQLRIGAAEASRSRPPTGRTEFQTAVALAGSLAELLGELSCSRTALARREAELAAATPVAAHPDEPVHLAERLLAVLRGGAEGIGCQAAGLYLLDAATTQLKLRSCWGLAPDRLVEPARPLRGAVADLEALTGHAVVLSHPGMLEYWHVPESCAAAVCVPVSTATSLLGTLWMFSDEPREFSDRETNLVEIVAGRLAGELEREMLLSDGVASADLRHQIDAGRRLLDSQSPRITPLADPWEVAGWSCQPAGVGGTFHDWFALPDGSVAISVGDAQMQGIEAALVGQAVRSAVRAHAAHSADPGQTLGRVSQDLWSGSAGDQFAAAMHAVLCPHSGRLHLATAGNIRVGVLQRDGWQALSTSEIPLGVLSDRPYEAQQTTLRLGAALIILTDGIPALAGTGADRTALADALRPHHGSSATRILGAIRTLAEGAAPVTTGHGGWAAMVITRK